MQPRKRLQTALAAVCLLVFLYGCATKPEPLHPGAFARWKRDTQRIAPLNPSADITLHGYEELHTDPR